MFVNGIATRVAASVGALAAETGVTTDLDTILTTIKGGLADLSVANLGKVLIAGTVIALPLVLAWFGYRWVKRRAMSAITKGKL